jgi:hypothetical protein
LGYSPGKLMMYRDQYKKDGIIRGPTSIMDQLGNEDAQKEYLAYLHS